MAVVNEIKLMTAEMLLARGVTPPVITAAALVGPDRSTELFDAAYAEHAPRATGAVAGASDPTDTSSDNTSSDNTSSDNTSSDGQEQ